MPAYQCPHIDVGQVRDEKSVFSTRAVCNAQAVGLTENTRPLPRENGAGRASVSRETKGNCVPFPEQQDPQGHTCRRDRNA